MVLNGVRVFALVRTLLFASVFIAGVLVYFPWWLGVFRWPDAWEPRWQLLGFVPLTLGSLLGLRCLLAFAWTGRGTPAPFDPPRRLVVEGLYRHVRNPMYWGAFLILAGQWMLFGRRWDGGVYVLCFAALAHLFVRFHEEPSLRRRFGAEYDNYCRMVPRWLPRLRPW